MCLRSISLSSKTKSIQSSPLLYEKMRHPLPRPTRLVTLSMAPLDALRCLQEEGLSFSKLESGRFTFEILLNPRFLPTSRTVPTHLSPYSPL